MTMKQNIQISTLMLGVSFLSACDTNPTQIKGINEFVYSSSSDPFTKSFVSQAKRTFIINEKPNVDVVITCDRGRGEAPHANVAVGVTANGYTISNAAVRFDNGNPINAFVRWDAMEPDIDFPVSTDIAASRELGDRKFDLRERLENLDINKLKNMTIRNYVSQQSSRDIEIDATVPFNEPAVAKVLRDCGFTRA